MKKIITLYNSNLSIWVVLFAVVAYLYPPSFLFVKPFIKLFFSITMFGIGLVITTEDYKNVIKAPKQILFGVLCQYSIMPLLAFVTAYVFSLPDAFKVGLILTGSAPGAMTSNVISYLSDGDVTYSVSLTAIATMLSPVLTPLITLALAGHHVPVKFFPMFLTIVYTVVIPLVLGFLVRKKFPTFFPYLTEKVGDIPATISVTAIVVITSYVVAANKETINVITFIIFGAVVFHNFIGMALGFLAGHVTRFNFKRKKTLSIEIGMQNAGLGVILALTHFSKEVAVPAAIFTIWCIISASLLVRFWKFFDRGEVFFE